MTAPLDPEVSTPAERVERNHLAELHRAGAALVQRSAADGERWLLLGGAVLVPVGILTVLAGYWGAANAPRVIQQIPYQISGGLFGLALVFAGGFSYFAWWLTRIVRTQQRTSDRIDAQTAALTAELAEVRRTIAVALERLAPVQAPPSLVSTPSGSLVHRSTCSIVNGRTDLRSAPSGAKPCKGCRPDLEEA